MSLLSSRSLPSQWNATCTMMDEHAWRPAYLTNHAHNDSPESLCRSQRGGQQRCSKCWSRLPKTTRCSLCPVQRASERASRRASCAKLIPDTIQAGGLSKVLVRPHSVGVYDQMPSSGVSLLRVLNARSPWSDRSCVSLGSSNPCSNGTVTKRRRVTTESAHSTRAMACAWLHASMHV
jgi:hypothetical protein